MSHCSNSLTRRSEVTEMSRIGTTQLHEMTHRYPPDRQSSGSAGHPCVPWHGPCDLETCLESVLCDCPTRPGSTQFWTDRRVEFFSCTVRRGSSGKTETNRRDRKSIKRDAGEWGISAA